MNKYNFFPLLSTFVLCLCLTSCGDDGPAPDPVDQNNTNANKTATPEASRLEIPHLVGGNTIFLVKKAKLSDNGSKMFVNFCIEWDCDRKAQRWTAYRWDIDNIVDNNVGRTEAWAEDTDIPSQYRSTSYNHQSNGYDRGHMLASEDRQCSVSANSQTFLLSNMHPQYNKFNGKSNNVSYVWLNLEIRLRNLYKAWTKTYNYGDTIYVVKGGTIADNQILETKKGIPVPKYFFVALLYYKKADVNNVNNVNRGYKGYRAIGYWIEHTNGTNTANGSALNNYCVSIDVLEQKTGIDFFCNLPDEIENKVESTCNLTQWGGW
ncbi:MAG: DNA/RNA non-specific endonuclease [Bacteroidaceae bacterium]|nr:DNA/RNA non-specific endonuclease [Bacteroidaceae bacterium]